MSFDGNQPILPPVSAPAYAPVSEKYSSKGKVRTQNAGAVIQASHATAKVDRRPRKISVQAASADRLLSHAIEYLTDSRHLPDGRIGNLHAYEPDVQALFLLMEARHAVYLACPVIERRSPLNFLNGFRGPERRKE